MITMRQTTLIAALALILLIAGCAQYPQESTPTITASGEVIVELRNLQFQPKPLTVKAGTTVVFINRDAGRHNVVQIAARQVGKAEPGFSSAPLSQDERFTVTFEHPGTYPMVCTEGAHHTAGMVATVKVIP